MSGLPLEEQAAQVARKALDAVIAGLTEEEVYVPERVVYLVPGDSIVWDQDADQCGGNQLTARLSNLVPHRTGGTKQIQMTPCSIDYWTATFEVTILRCAAVVDNQGNAPTPDRLLEDGMMGMKDLAIILRALTKMDEVDDVTSWTPQGPSGGVFGTQWNFTTKLDSTPCE